MSERALTPTSYLLLALMGLRPWSAYELAEQMKRGFQYVWPKAERAFYYEAKRLAEEGYARVVDAPVGERPRVLYELTEQGEEALAAWLADRDPTPTRIESETLGRLFFAEYGTIEDLRAAADAVEADGRAALELVAERAHIYLEEGTEFPSRLHLIALAGRFIADYGAMLVDYADWIRKTTAGWEDTGADGKSAQVLEIFEALWEETTRRLEGGGS